MKLSVGRYSVVLGGQLLLLIADVFFNLFSEALAIRQNSSVLLVFYLFQISFQIITITLLFVSLFNTNVFEAGLVELLFERFLITFLVMLVYVLLTIALQTWTLSARWTRPVDYNWPTGYSFVYALQRFGSSLHYYFYKRAALRLSDPRFYDDEWIKHSIYQ